MFLVRYPELYNAMMFYDRIRRIFSLFVIGANCAETRCGRLTTTEQRIDI